MKEKPIIGISGNMMIDQGGMFPGYERAYVNDDYVQAVIRGGGIPFIIPISECEEVIKAQVKNMDGFIFSGGYDVNPLLYGEEPSQKLGEIYPKRDVFDAMLMKMAMEHKKPIIGICRGMQMLNVVSGGSLYQDLSYIKGCYIKHVQGHSPSIPTHTVDIVEGTKLHNILGEQVVTNSFHHLALKDIAPGFIVCARAKDGVVEAIEKNEDTFVLGLQWHPEMMSKDHPNMDKIFKKLIEESKK